MPAAIRLATGIRPMSTKAQQELFDACERLKSGGSPRGKSKFVFASWRAMLISLLLYVEMKMADTFSPANHSHLTKNLLNWSEDPGTNLVSAPLVRKNGKFLNWFTEHTPGYEETENASLVKGLPVYLQGDQEKVLALLKATTVDTKQWVGSISIVDGPLTGTNSAGWAFPLKSYIVNEESAERLAIIWSGDLKEQVKLLSDSSSLRNVTSREKRIWGHLGPKMLRWIDEAQKSMDLGHIARALKLGKDIRDQCQLREVCGMLDLASYKAAKHKWMGELWVVEGDWECMAQEILKDEEEERSLEEEEPDDGSLYTAMLRKGVTQGSDAEISDTELLEYVRWTYCSYD